MRLALSKHTFRFGFNAADGVPGHALTLEEASDILRKAGAGWLKIAHGEAACKELLDNEYGPALLIVDLEVRFWG